MNANKTLECWLGVLGLLAFSGCHAPARVPVAAGRYDLGCNAWAFCADNPVHAVTLARFAIDRLEVTMAQYNACVRARACPLPRAVGEPGEAAARQLGEARAYCHWAGGRLPTGDEWELAARGPAPRKFSWGDVWDPEKAAWYAHTPPTGDTSYGYFRVGTLPHVRSPWGAEDMSGDAPELVESDPTHPEVRGAMPGFFREPDDFAVAKRHRVDADAYAGFRCVYDRL